MSRGPATVQDFAKWSGLTTTDARHGLEDIKPQLQAEVVDGQPYWFSVARPPSREASPSAYLLSVYDEYISGYQDRRAIVDARHAAQLSAMGNALTHVVVVDGQIVGTWKRTLRKSEVVIETHLFTRPTRAHRRAIAAAANQYGTFLGLAVVLAEA